MKNLILKSVVGISICTCLSCASLTGFQTAKTVGDGNGEFGFSINYSASPNFGDDDFSDDVEDVVRFFPIVEFNGRLGVTDRTDVGLRMNSVMNLGLDVKTQVYGESDSDVAFALGAGIGTFGFIAGEGGIFNFQIPVYLSIHPKDNFAFYVSPRYVGQFGTAFGESSGLVHYYGANTGILFGRKKQIGFDLGLYGFDFFGDRTFLTQFGFGMKFQFKD